MKLIQNGILYTMEGAVYEKGFVLIDGKKIQQAGDMCEFTVDSSDMEVYDAGGGYIFPGFVDAHSHIGMWGDAQGFESADGNEETDPATPQLSALDSINPFDRCFLDAQKGGVTSVVTGPGSANVIGGQFIAMKTWGRCVDDMVIKNPVALKVAFGENPKTVYHEKHQFPSTRMATAALLREMLYRAREYDDKIKKYEQDPEENDKPDFDFKLESMRMVVQKQIPLKVHAHRADDIFTAIRIARQFDIDITIDHCTEGHLIADELKEAGYPVMVGPSLCDRSKPELANLTFATPGILAKKGLDVAVISDHAVIPCQYLNLCAALSVREGMDEMDALRAITITAAKNARIDDRVGSIKPGKDADVVVFDRYPLDIMARAKMVFIDGSRVV